MSFSTSKPWEKVKRAQGSQNASGIQTRFANAPQSPGKLEARNQQKQLSHDPEHLADLAAAVDRVIKAFLAQQGIPSEHMTLTALRACAQANAKLALDSPQEQQAAATGPSAASDRDLETTASHLLDLDAHARKAANVAAPQKTPPLQLQEVVDKISDAAYAIVSHPAVVITPSVLKEYVDLQARLGKPETLPQILELSASKPRPRLVSGAIEYVKQKPHRMENAIDSDTAERALDVALEAKHLDAAIGIVENTYATKSFVRSKVVRKALLPLSVLGATPAVAYVVATKLSLLQESMDQATATSVAFAGIVAYVGFTATIGLVATTTENDQMKRVTWAPGTPLRERWLREEERAALDRVACSIGFSEEHRWGEEEGEEFQLLREYIFRKGMILDAVELMPGMN